VPETIDQEIYAIVMNVKIRDRENRETTGRFIRSKQKQRSLQETNPYDFNLNITEQTPREIRMELKFENEETLKSGNVKGILDIEITKVGLQLFRIKETGQPLSTEGIISSKV
jgi:hypothetical protein